MGCFGNGDEKDSKFGSGENDLSDGPTPRKGCTDILCIPLFLAAQVVFIVVSIIGVNSGDPTKLYKPRDYMGNYCGVETNWNSGPKTTSTPVLSYTMNVSSTADVMMKRFVCSSAAKNALLNGQQGMNPIAPLLTTQQEKDDYNCACCHVPCKSCDGGLDNGGDLDINNIGSIISGQMKTLTDPAEGASLFSPSGPNGNQFSSSNFWTQATKYFNMVCLKDCDTDYTSIDTNTATTYRDFVYTPAADTPFYTVWEKILSAPSNSLTTALKTTATTAFTFKALPYAVCPYENITCVPFPGVEFDELTAGASYCMFKLSAGVTNAISGAAASAFAGMGGEAFTSASSETFGQWMGDIMVALDSFIIVAVCSFVVGIVFLILLRFFVGVCVWLAVFSTVLVFVLGGSFTFVLSGQCEGASIWATGVQATKQVAVAASTATANAVQGTPTASEALTGDGADYRGVQTITKSGKACLTWGSSAANAKMSGYTTQNYPDADLKKNFCRNPYLTGSTTKAATIWCITSDPEVDWEECSPIGVIMPECEKGYAIKGQQARDALFYISFVIWGFSIIQLILILCFVKRIRLAIALNKVAAVFVAGNCSIVVVPLVQAIVALCWCLLWFFMATFLLSQVPADYTPTAAYETYTEAYGTYGDCQWWESGDKCGAVAGKCTGRWPTGGVYKDSRCVLDAGVAKCWKCYPPRYILDVRFFVSFFVFLWNNAFNVALGQILIAMAVGLWFFTSPENKGITPVVCKAVKWVFRYHLGSVAFGSFIVAVVEFIRYIMKYFEKQAEAQKNKFMVFLLKCVQCCIWCFEKCIKFLNKNAYIQVALTGKSFCPAAMTAFWLIMRNMARFGLMAALGSIISAIGFLFITSGSVVVGYFIVKAMHPDISPFMPCVCFTFIGYVVARLFMNVFGLAVDTSLQCFLAVEESGQGGDFVPPVLQNFVNTKKCGVESEDKEQAE